MLQTLLLKGNCFKILIGTFSKVLKKPIANNGYQMCFLCFPDLFGRTGGGMEMRGR